MAKRYSAQDLARSLGVEAGSEESARRVFARFDRDGSGRIAKDELLRILKTLVPELSMRDCQAVFHCLDVNRDLAVDYNEFVAWSLSGTRENNLAD
eukprot:CAMPEP_0197630354 /NCGR_PEP_ID=MMETSP1338-20131121/7871_1 /TAXON_ID=43686 ORGANISM="Pelagodinium beii, Strain RCC1491" /NCGR_SAMPLE_ID=MMETSP1338 /ASSEMBLY_ACC=CAM_ASM_000754 /LENGTH=95 /DNA_ID=CAMNT_0043201557 /DNA_START=10 /DNA_END=294 /DNA_ORIENTATION=+